MACARIARRIPPNSGSFARTARLAAGDGKGRVRRGRAVVRLKGLTRDVTELKRAEEHQKSLVAELDHRVKNALACVSAIAQRSREGNPSMDEFLEVFDGRILSSNTSTSRCTYCDRSRRACDIRLDGLHISSCHARIAAGAHGFTIEDLGSTMRPRQRQTDLSR